MQRDVYYIKAHRNLRKSNDRFVSHKELCDDPETVLAKLKHHEIVTFSYTEM